MSNDSPSEAIKCKCRSHQPCQWEQKGKSCFTKSNLRKQLVDQFEQKLDSQLIDSLNSQSGLVENILDSIDISPGGVQSESITLSAGDLANKKNIETGDELAQLIRDIHVTNTGHMVFNLNYINKL